MKYYTVDELLKYRPYKDMATLLDIDEEILSFGSFRTTISLLTALIFRGYSLFKIKDVNLAITDKRVLVVPLKKIALTEFTVVDLKISFSVPYEDITIDEKTLYIQGENNEKPLKLKFKFGYTGLDKEFFIFTLRKLKNN